MAKLIVVFGATGTQGGSVARALLNDPRSFRVRAVTRNPNSERAQALENLGAELVRADFDDPSSLSEALSDCHGVFGVTNYAEHHRKDREVQQGKALVDACKDAGVQHLVFSLLPSTKEAVLVEVPFFESKAEIETYMFESGIACTSVHYPFYMENILTPPFKPKEQHDNTYGLIIPIEVPFALLAAKDAGKAVAAIFRCPDNYYGKTIRFAGDKKNVKQMAAILSKHLTPTRFRAALMPIEQFSRMGFPGADDYASMFDFMQSGNHKVNLTLTRHLDPGTKTFEEWVVANKDTLQEVFADD